MFPRLAPHAQSFAIDLVPQMALQEIVGCGRIRGGAEEAGPLYVRDDEFGFTVDLFPRETKRRLGVEDQSVEVKNERANQIRLLKRPQTMSSPRSTRTRSHEESVKQRRKHKRADLGSRQDTALYSVFSLSCTTGLCGSPCSETREPSPSAQPTQPIQLRNYGCAAGVVAGGVTGAAGTTGAGVVVVVAGVVVVVDVAGVVVVVAGVVVVVVVVAGFVVVVVVAGVVVVDAAGVVVVVAGVVVVVVVVAGFVVVVVVAGVVVVVVGFVVVVVVAGVVVVVVVGFVVVVAGFFSPQPASPRTSPTLTSTQIALTIRTRRFIALVSPCLDSVPPAGARLPH